MTKQTPNETYTATIVLEPDPEEGGWLGSVPDVPGVRSDGDTISEALVNTAIALAEVLRG